MFEYVIRRHRRLFSARGCRRLTVTSAATRFNGCGYSRHFADGLSTRFSSHDWPMDSQRRRRACLDTIRASLIDWAVVSGF